MRTVLEHQDFSKFNPIKPKLLEVVDGMLQSDIARLMNQIPKEEQLERAAAIAESAQNGEPPKSELFDKKVRNKSVVIECLKGIFQQRFQMSNWKRVKVRFFIEESHAKVLAEIVEMKLPFQQTENAHLSPLFSGARRCV